MPSSFSIYQVDAFTNELFRGNPAAVCPLQNWLSDDRLQQIAAENNLSETAFLVGGNGQFHLRWMTPTVEVDLCGHATLAAAWVVFHKLEPGRSEVAFETRSGTLRVQAEGDWLRMDFPLRPPIACDPPADVEQALGVKPLELLRSRDYFAVLATPEEVASLRPDFRRLATWDSLGVIVTAAGGEGVDFVSRFFAPQSGIDEDPVTGSAHSTLGPYWAAKLGKTSLKARQISARGGELRLQVTGSCVQISGQAVLYLEGAVFLPD
jgi:PhzF family phenazine biosynthesis protein